MKPDVSFPCYPPHATVRILSHINSFQALPSYFLTIHFNIILPLTLGLPSGLFRLG